ncbi:MAG: ATP-dependent DNA ligase [Candidatus Pseudobacter hemicellulosilyticus]|uniref:DNA ligase (ATP) n=1 Tax=Candidatus Pseudobacter hemicellulosilyticus TaxID=3121375 RepID=A0AAJ6BGY8_9BACT|nr:MAG: ATP-dependent DNA ligase [Pseudobacter sp.]
MKQFADLVQVLGTSTKTNEKLEALSAYFSSATDKDKVWVIAIFSGRRPKRTVNSTQLSAWCNELVQLPAWLFDECYHTVGDLAETIALLLPPATESSASHPLHYYLETLISIEKAEEAIRKEFIVSSWRTMSKEERFVFNKLLTGGFRIGVSQKMMVNALARFIQLEPSLIAHRISGNWDPATTPFNSLLSEEAVTIDFSKPYPFYLAYALEEELPELGQPDQWQAEWKWDGIRGQLIRRNDELFVWSRGEELITDKFPEFFAFRELLPNGLVLDGEIMPFNGEKPLPFSVLQTRIGRKNVTKKQLQEAPAAFFLYDLLEYEGADCREQPLQWRRQQLEKLLAQYNNDRLQLSPIVGFSNWEQLTDIRTESRERGAEGLMLKRLSSAYQVGRKKGDWWKWKINPLVIDCVMIYAQKGHGRRSNLYTDYTFAVRDGEKLVSFTKAYSGLTDEEFRQVDAFVKRNSLEKFGPVRTVKPELVFEIAFEGIAASKRHKSGVALRFPRMNRWRKDKKPGDINTLEDLQKMLEIYGK